mgnify:CR=1 FL=1
MICNWERGACNWERMLLRAMVVLALYPPVIIFLALLVAVVMSVCESAHHGSISECEQIRGHLRGFKPVVLMEESGSCLHDHTEGEETQNLYARSFLWVWVLNIPWVISVFIVFAAVAIICIIVIARSAYRCLKLLWSGVRVCCRRTSGDRHTFDKAK